MSSFQKPLRVTTISLGILSILLLLLWWVNPLNVYQGEGLFILVTVIIIMVLPVIMPSGLYKILVLLSTQILFVIVMYLSVFPMIFALPSLFFSIVSLAFEFRLAYPPELRTFKRILWIQMILALAPTAVFALTLISSTVVERGQYAFVLIIFTVMVGVLIPIRPKLAGILWVAIGSILLLTSFIWFTLLTGIFWALGGYYLAIGYMLITSIFKNSDKSAFTN